MAFGIATHYPHESEKRGSSAAVGGRALETGQRPDSRFLADEERDGWLAALDAVQRQVGNSWLSDLQSRGPQSAWDLQVLHLLWLAQETQADVTAYLPWAASLSWNNQVAPYYRILLGEIAGDTDIGPAPPTSMGPGIADVLGADLMSDLGLSGAGFGGLGVTGVALSAPGPDAGGADLAEGAHAAALREATGRAGGSTGAPFFDWFDRMLKASGSGRPLSAEEQGLVENVHGRTFPQARIHANAAARIAADAINARAFAVGTDVFVGASGLEGAAGAEVLAHEMTHVGQAIDGRLPAPRGDGLDVSNPADQHEQEAYAMGRAGRAAWQEQRAAQATAELTEQGDQWGIAVEEAPDTVGRMILDNLRTLLASAPTDPPPGLVEDGVEAFLRERALGVVRALGVQLDVIDTSGRVATDLRAALAAVEAELLEDEAPDTTAATQLLLALAGRPTQGELQALQSGFAPYPQFARAADDLIAEVEPSVPDHLAAVGAPDGATALLPPGAAIEISTPEVALSMGAADLSADLSANSGGDTGSVEAMAAGGAFEGAMAMPEAHAAPSIDPAIEDRIRRSRGSPIDPSTAARLGSLLGHDVSDVRVHTDSEAAQAAESIRAHAFTLGRDVFFAPGQFAPGTTLGDHILIHELTHARQHAEGRLPEATGDGVEVSHPSDATEREAAATADQLAGTGSMDLASVDLSTAEVNAGLDAPAAGSGPATDVGTVMDAGATALRDSEGGIGEDSPSNAGPKASEEIDTCQGNDEEIEILAEEIQRGGEKRAIEMLQQSRPEDRAIVEQAVKQALGAAKGDELIMQARGPDGGPAQEGDAVPVVDNPTAADPTTPGPDELGTEEGSEEGTEEGSEQCVDEEGVDEETLTSGPDESTPDESTPDEGTDTSQAVTAPAPAPEPAAPDLSSVGTSDLALIHQELIEHQRWGGARQAVGEPGSPERAAWIAQKSGEGAIAGGSQGLVMGFAGGVVGKLAQKFIPIPGVGAILGGAMAGYSLATRDWGKTGDTISKFGEGDSIYEQMANTIASVSELIDVASQVLQLIAGVIGVISAVMWIISIVTLGVASPLAATLSAIALAIGAVTTLMDIINNTVLQPLVLLFRAMHAFQDQSDPREVEAQGGGLSEASSKTAGQLGAWAGSKAGDVAGGKIGDRISGSGKTSSPTAKGDADGPAAKGDTDGPAPKAAADGPTAKGDTDGPAPKAATDGPTAKGDAEGPGARQDPEVARKQADAADAAVGQQRKKGMEAIKEEFRAHRERQAQAAQRRQEEVDRARQQASETKAAEIEAQRKVRHDEIDADTARKVDSIEGTRQAVEAEARQTAHEHLMADTKAAHEARMKGYQDASDQVAMAREQADVSQRQRQDAINREYLDKRMLDLESRQIERAKLNEIKDPDLRAQMESHWEAQRRQRIADADLDYAQRNLENAQQNKADIHAANTRNQEARAQVGEAHARATEQAEATHKQVLDDAGHDLDQRVAAEKAAAQKQRGAANEQATSRKGEVDEAGQRAAEQVEPGAKANEQKSVSESEQKLSQTRKAEGYQAVKDSMKQSNSQASVQSKYRPEFMKKAAGQEGTLRHWLVDKVAWPFISDLIGPFTINKKLNLDADGHPTSMDPNYDKWKRLGDADGPQAPYSRGGAVAAQNKTVGKYSRKIAKKAYDSATKEDKPKAAGGSGEAGKHSGVNPAYEDPPGAPEQLAMYLDQIEALMKIRADAQATEQAMAQQQASHEANVAPIDEVVDQSQQSIDIAATHQAAVAERKAANEEQQKRQKDSEGLVTGFAGKATGFAMLTVPLQAFRGFTWIASKIPGGAGRAMKKMNADANKFSDALSSMNSSMDQQADAQPAVQEGLKQDADTISQTADAAVTSNDDFATANEGAVCLADANEQKATDAAAAKEEARGQGDAAETKLDENKAAHADLSTQLTGWAHRHKEARLSALAAQQTSVPQAAPTN